MKKYLWIVGIVIFSVSAWGTKNYNNERGYYKSKTRKAGYRGVVERYNNPKFYQKKKQEKSINIAGASGIRIVGKATDNTNTGNVSGIQIAGSFTNNTNSENISKIQIAEISSDNARIKNSLQSDAADKTGEISNHISGKLDVGTNENETKVVSANSVEDSISNKEDANSIKAKEQDIFENIKNANVPFTLEDEASETDSVNLELRSNSKNTNSLTFGRGINHDSVNHTVYIDGKFMRINFESINNDQRDIFCKYFRGRRLQTQTKTVQYARREKNIRYNRLILSLGLKTEELDKISIYLLEFLEPTGDFKIKGWDTIAKNLERPILIVECKNGNICGFYEYGKEFSEDRRKIILMDGKNRKQLVYITDQSIPNAILNVGSITDWNLFDEVGQIQINSENEISTDDPTEIPDMESELQKNEEKIFVEPSEDQSSAVNDLPTSDADLSGFSTEPMEVDEIIDIAQNSEGNGIQNWFDVVKRGDLNQLVAWKQSPLWNAYVDSVDERGNTAIMLAIKGKKADVVKFFLEQKANIFASNKDGDSALSLAKKSDNAKIVEFFEKYNNISVSGKVGNVQLSYIPIVHEKIANYRNALYGDFVERSFKITDNGSTYKKYRFQCPFCSLGLTDEEQEKIPEFLREYSHKCKGITADDKGFCKIRTRTDTKVYDIRKHLQGDVWSEIADILQYRILIYEYNDRDKGEYFGKIVGFYEYGAQYAANGTKRILLSQNKQHYLNMSDINSDVVSQGILEGESSKTNQTNQMEIDSPANDFMSSDGSVTQGNIILEKIPQLFDAIKNGNAEFIKRFIEEYDEEDKRQSPFDEKDENGIPLFFLAMKNSEIRQQYDLMEFLLEHVQDINARDAENFTMLMRAVQYADEDIVHLLIDFGADIKAANEEGKTAISITNELLESVSKKLETEKAKDKKEELKKEVKKYKKIINLINEFLRRQERDTSTEDSAYENNASKEDIIKKYGQETVDLVVDAYNSLPEHTEKTLTEVTSKVKIINRKIARNDVSNIFTYAKNSGLLKASNRAENLKHIIYRARRSRRWTDRGIANRYKIRDYDALIVTRNMPLFKTVRVVLEEGQRAKSLSDKEKTEIAEAWKQKYLSDYGILCKYHINEKELLEVVDIIPQEFFDKLDGKISRINKGVWDQVFKTWFDTSFNLQEQLKSIVDPSYKPKLITRDYIEKVAGKGGKKGLPRDKFNRYSASIKNPLKNQRLKKLARLINYIFAQKIGQKLYFDEDLDVLRIAGNIIEQTPEINKMEKEQQEAAKNEMYKELRKAVNSSDDIYSQWETVINYWLTTSHEQRVKLATKLMLENDNDEDKKFLKKWKVLLKYADKGRMKLLEALKDNNFKRSDLIDMGKSKGSEELDEKLANHLVGVSKKLKKVIQYVIDKEELRLTDDDIEQEGMSEESSNEANSQNSRKRKADQSLVSSSKTQQSSRRKRAKKSIVSSNKKETQSNVLSSKRRK